MTWCKKCHGKGAIKRDHESMVGCNATEKGAVICSECRGSGYDEEVPHTEERFLDDASNEVEKPEEAAPATPDWMEGL